MKKFFGFLFGYGQLGWKSRLSRPDHLYHQGRNAIAVVLCTAYGLGAYFMMLLLAMKLNLDAQPTTVQLAFTVVGAFVTTLPLMYVSFAAVKLTVLRLHDFNRSGWWLLAAFPLALANVAADKILPGIHYFVSFTGLAYLALLILPASPQPNRFGSQETNSTSGKPRFIRAIPIILFAIGWLLQIFNAFMVQHMMQVIHETEMQTAAAQRQMEEAIAKFEHGKPSTGATSGAAQPSALPSPTTPGSSTNLNQL